MSIFTLSVLSLLNLLHSTVAQSVGVSGSGGQLNSITLSAEIDLNVEVQFSDNLDASPDEDPASSSDEASADEDPASSADEASTDEDPASSGGAASADGDLASSVEHSSALPSIPERKDEGMPDLVPADATSAVEGPVSPIVDSEASEKPNSVPAETSATVEARTAPETLDVMLASLSPLEQSDATERTEGNDSQQRPVLSFPEGSETSLQHESPAEVSGAIEPSTAPEVEEERVDSISPFGGVSSATPKEGSPEGERFVVISPRTSEVESETRTVNIEEDDPTTDVFEPTIAAMTTTHAPSTTEVIPTKGVKGETSDPPSERIVFLSTPGPHMSSDPPVPFIANPKVGYYDDYTEGTQEFEYVGAAEVRDEQASSAYEVDEEVEAHEAEEVKVTEVTEETVHQVKEEKESGEKAEESTMKEREVKVEESKMGVDPEVKNTKEEEHVSEMRESNVVHGSQIEGKNENKMKITEMKGLKEDSVNEMREQMREVSDRVEEGRPSEDYTSTIRESPAEPSVNPSDSDSFNSFLSGLLGRASSPSRRLREGTTTHHASNPRNLDPKVVRIMF